MTKEKTEVKHGKREIVTPGEIIAKGDFLPGDWTTKEGEEIIANRFGIVDKTERLVRVVPITGVYIPRRGNVVIAEVADITMNGWIMEIKAPYQAFLMLKECPMYVDEYEMENVYGIGDLVVTKIVSVKRRAIDLTTKGRGLDKIKDGMIVEINPHRVPRVIGKEGSMISQIKIASGCDITVGQNGLIWVRGRSKEEELFAKKIIDFIVENTTSDGLTEQVEQWIKENKPKNLGKIEGKEAKEKTEEFAESSVESESQEFGEEKE